METRSFEQQVAQSEMARVVANIVVSSSEMVCPSRKVLICVEQRDWGSNETAVTRG
jgi:hypothetical protein